MLSFLFLFFFFSTQRLEKIMMCTCFYSIPFIFVSHCLEVGEGGGALWLRGVATKHEFLISPACADPVSCPWSRIIFSRRETAGLAERSEERPWRQGGVRGRGGLPWPGGSGAALARGRVRVSGGSERSCESRRDGLPWPPSSPRCSQAVLSLVHRIQSGTERESLLYWPQKAPLMGRPTPAIAVWSPAAEPTLCQEQVTFPHPTGALRGSEPREGAQPGHGTSTGTYA